ncbi:hypothetical protein BD626DRAFT_513669 [Schizophyllum amplum]|uniref:MYND-type domain-containing protein n=1 Tax=Schizophyllum amplum TaxID=97359 RepID=A0A550BZ64_9AGAR|nr:hypothetical protein BD626DRAFT_513669 [Auriculariopsis ampla]
MPSDTHDDLSSIMGLLWKLSRVDISDPSSMPERVLLSQSIELHWRTQRPFAVLEDEPPLNDGHQPMASDEDPLDRVFLALDNYRSLCIFIERESHVNLLVEARDYAEAMTSNVYRWLQVDPTDNFVQVVFAMLLLPRDDYSLIRLFSMPRFVEYIVDIWANFFRYNGTLPRVYLILNDGIMAADKDLVRGVGRRLLAEEMHRVFGKHPRRLCRVVVRHLDVLRAARPEEYRVERASLTIANEAIDHDKTLRPRTCPRRIVTKIVSLIDRRSREFDIPAYAVAVFACMYLDHLWRVTQDSRTLIWSISDGVVRPILRMLSALPASHDLASRLQLIMRTLVRGLVHYRVLLVFHRMHAGDPALRDAASVTIDAAALAEVYAARFPLLCTSREAWKIDVLHCHNEECNKRRYNIALSSCVCRRAYYCSTRCQRVHWITAHHRECHVRAGQSATHTFTPLLTPL